MAKTKKIRVAYNVPENYKSDHKRETPTVKRCTDCGHRIRGAEHEKGAHHNKTVKQNPSKK